MARKDLARRAGRGVFCKRLAAAALSLCLLAPLSVRAAEGSRVDWRDRYDFIEDSREGFFAVNVGGELQDYFRGSFIAGGAWGFADAEGSLAVPAVYSRVDPFQNGRAMVQLGGDNSHDDHVSGSPSPYWNRAHPGWYDGGVGVIDRQGRRVIPCVWEDVSPIEDGSFKVLRDGKWGLMDRDGKLLIPPKWEWLEKTAQGYIVADEASPFGWNGAFGLLDGDGKELLPPVYASMNSGGEGLICVSLPREPDELEETAVYARTYGYTDLRGNWVIPPTYRDASFFENGVALVTTMEGKSGLIDRKGRWVGEPFPAGSVSADLFGRNVPQERLEQVGPFATLQWLEPYACVEPFHENRAAFQADPFGAWGYLDMMGREAIPPAFIEAGAFENGRAAARTENGWGVIDIDGEALLPCAQEAVERMPDGTFKFRQNGLWGLSDWDGNILVKPLWHVLDYYAENRFLVSETAAGPGEFGDYGLIDRNGKPVTPRIYSRIEPCADGRGLVASGTPKSGVKYGYLDARGNLKIPPDYDEANPFSDGVAPVGNGHGDETRWGLIDADGVPLTELRWLEFERRPPSFYSDATRWEVRGPDGVGLMENYGNWVIDPVYEEVGAFYRDTWPVKQTGLWGYMNDEGEWVFQPQFGQAGASYLGFAIVQPADGGQWGLMGKSGQWVLPPIYDSLSWTEFSPDICLAAEQNGRIGLLNLDADGSLSLVCPPILSFIEFPANVHYAQWACGGILGDLAFDGKIRVCGFGDRIEPLGNRDYSDLYRYRLLGKWGVTSHLAENIAPPRFDEITAIKNGPCMVRDGERRGLLYLNLESHF